MSLPFFYKEDIDLASHSIILDEVASKHIVQVLRMHNGEQLQLTNGKGLLLTAEIADDNRKKCTVTILTADEIKPIAKNTTIAISLVKNSSRFEWFLEKATEMGVTTIIPIVCKRTEKQYFRLDRMQHILVSAMLQSQQCWLPVLHAPIRFEELVARQPGNCKMYIAHCEDDKARQPFHRQIDSSSDQLIVIGPEGDFTPGEIQLAVGYHFIPVSLGNTRLRTETAGVVAAALLTQL